MGSPKLGVFWQIILSKTVAFNQLWRHFAWLLMSEKSEFFLPIQLGYFSHSDIITVITVIQNQIIF